MTTLITACSETPTDKLEVRNTWWQAMNARRYWQPEELLNVPGNVLTNEQLERDSCGQKFENKLTLSTGTRTMIRLKAERENFNRNNLETRPAVTYTSSIANNQRDEDKKKEKQEQIIKEACDITHQDVPNLRILVSQGLVRTYNAEQETNGTAQLQIRDMHLLCDQDIPTATGDEAAKKTGLAEVKGPVYGSGNYACASHAQVPRAPTQGNLLGHAEQNVDISNAATMSIVIVARALYTALHTLLFRVILFVCAVYAMTRCLFE